MTGQLEFKFRIYVSLHYVDAANGGPSFCGRQLSTYNHKTANDSPQIGSEDVSTILPSSFNTQVLMPGR